MAAGRLCRLHADTARLLRYWNDPEREKRLFFCQVEALETAIYITEVAASTATPGSRTSCARRTRPSTPACRALAFKMATGAGKTVVMAMLIAWQALNKLANPQDGRFSDTFLIVTPGITIRDRLRVLLPNDPENYYRAARHRPAGHARAARPGADRHHQLPRLHAARARRGGQADQGDPRQRASASPFMETPDQMVRRVCRELGNKKNIVVLNDEAHHCYRRKPDDDRRPRTEARRGDDRAGGEEARRRGPRLDLRPGGRQAQDRRQGGLRPVGDAVLPARLAATGGHAVPVGRRPTSR